jgi:hypothetical protein
MKIVPSPSPHRPALQPRLHRKIVIFIAGQPGGANPQNTKQSEPRPWDRLSVLRVADAGPARLAASSPQSPEIQAPKVAILATTIVQSAACRLLGQGETCQARASWPNVEAAVLKDGGAGPYVHRRGGPPETSTWVRLAQRIPVRIRIDGVPDGVQLVAGMTATIQIDPRCRARRGLALCLF